MSIQYDINIIKMLITIDTFSVFLKILILISE